MGGSESESDEGRRRHRYSAPGSSGGDPSGSEAPGRRLFGRDRVLATIDSLLDQIAAGQGTSMVLEGVAGVGKTTMLNRAAQLATAKGFDVRWATGVPSETQLPFGALFTILAPDLHSPTDGLVGSPALAAAAAVGVPSVSSPPTVRSVAAELLQLLSSHGRTRPVLVVLDDAHWLDSSSVEVLAAVARRVVADYVGVLIAQRAPARTGDTPPSGLRSDGRQSGSSLGDSVERRATSGPRLLAGIATIELQTLTSDETIAALVAGGVPVAEAEHWSTRCGGLPLAIAEVSARRPFAGADPRRIGDLLPDVYRNRVGALPADVVEAAVYAAVCADVAVLGALGRPGLLDALGAAEDAGLLIVDTPRVGHGEVLFRHPLVRAAVLARASTAQERAAHRAVAAVLRASEDSDRAALHLAAAVEGTDAEAASAMTGLAERAALRGALTEAAHAFARAAALTTTRAHRSRLLTRAADAHFDAGDAESAFTAVNEAIRLSTDPRDEADARSLRARMSMWVTSPRTMVRELVAVAEQMRSVDPQRAAAALAAASGAGYLDGDLRAAIDRGIAAEAAALEHDDVVTAATASGYLSWNTFLAGRWTESEQRLESLEPIMRAMLAERSWAGIHFAELFATTWVCSEDWDRAEPLIRHLLHATRVMGARLSVASTTLLLGSLLWRQGRWEEACAIELPLLDDVDYPPITLCWMRVLVAQLTATMGRSEQTRSLIDEAMPVATSADVPLIVAMAHAALGHLELSLGHDEAALVHLDRVDEVMERMEFREPEYFLWHGDHLEALLRAGRTDEVKARLDVLSKLANDGHRRWLMGVVARTEAQLLDGAAADARFEDAIRLHEALRMPFEVARTLLCRGQRHDRADARRLFLRLGATAWAEAALDPNMDVHDAGTPLRRANALGPVRLLEVLSPSQREVALAVVSGHTNREIAAELHLSAKTVDHYLQRAYRKLGVKNRTELAITIARATAAPEWTRR